MGGGCKYKKEPKSASVSRNAWVRTKQKGKDRMKIKELRAKKRAIVVKLPDSLKQMPGTIRVPKQPKCIIANCFTDKIFAHRDPDFDSWLPKTLPVSVEVEVSGYELTDTITEEEMAKVGKKFTNLLQIKNLILRTEKGENTRLLTNGYTNIFFLQVDTSVFVVAAYRSFGGWRVGLDRFRATCGWFCRASVFLPRNLSS